MTPRTRIPLTLAMGALALAAPATAQAAESFVGVTGGDHLVTFHSDTIPGLSAARAIAGLPAGEQLMALDTRPAGGLLALSTSGAVYALDAARHRITGTVARLPFAVPADAAATLTVAADGATARVIAGGHDATVGLATGSVIHDMPAPDAVAVDLGADGVLRGLDPTAGRVVSVDGAGVHTLARLPDIRATGATAATTASDGSTYMVTRIPRRNTPRQSRMLRFDPAIGRVRGSTMYFQRDLEGIAATGAVPDDATAPTAHVGIPRQSVRSALRQHGFAAVLRTSEGGQTVISARVGGHIRGFGLLTAERGGTYRVLVDARQRDIRAAAGRTVRLHFTVHDFAGNKRLLDATLRLGR